MNPVSMVFVLLWLFLVSLIVKNVLSPLLLTVILFICSPAYVLVIPLFSLFVNLFMEIFPVYPIILLMLLISFGVLKIVLLLCPQRIDLSTVMIIFVGSIVACLVPSLIVNLILLLILRLIL